MQSVYTWIVVSLSVTYLHKLKVKMEQMVSEKAEKF